MGKMDEMIVVVPRKHVFHNESLVFQGVTSERENIATIMNRINRHFSEMRRGDAEENDSYKQPIPYVVIRRQDDIFLYERLSGAGEARLHNKLSLGFGGHMNTIMSSSFQEMLEANTDRELHEELQFDKDKQKKTKAIGLINDDEEEVGRVHIGILSVLELADDAAVEVKEVNQMTGRWVPISDLKKEEIYERLESWSKFVVNILIKK
ncbi:hypothetical protein [Shouchella shacheensis]|uniref:hypothetical protein n=1 Tax=Shouchella shacheensis TaxID=1649580 RepID=UPI00073FE960|nr:hypothetical protein [Shouchella shacheensis]